MATQTLANLRDELSREIHDYLHSTVTTALAANNNLVDTLLANVKGGTTDNFCKNWWVLVTSNTNDGEIRRVSSYTALSKTIVTLGAAWTTDGANKATYELHKYHPTDKLDAINATARKTQAYHHLTDYQLVTGNILPDFEWWTSASAHKFYSASGATLARTSPGSGYTRGERYTALVTDSGAGDGYMYITSDNYPRLLDLQGMTVSVYAPVYCVSADDDAEIIIYTSKGTSTGAVTQTLTSITEVEQATWQWLLLENQELNTDLDEIQIRMSVVTAGNTAYYGPPVLLGKNVNGYMLPELFQKGQLDWVRTQRTSTGNDMPFYDIGQNQMYDDYFGWWVVEQDVNGAYYKFLRTPEYLSRGYKIELSGHVQLEDSLTADTDTISIDTEYSQRFILECVRQLYRMQRGMVSSETSDFFEKEIMRLDYEIAQLGNKRMSRPPTMLRMR